MRLEIHNLTKVYPNGLRALDDLTFETGAGMFGLLGPNGAGKSSLMRTIATLQRPDSGTIHFNGLDVWAQPRALRHQLGYLPQSFGVYPRQSARRLLEYFAVLKGVESRKDRNRIIDEVLALTNLTEVQHKHVSDYSGGMKQRFGIAQLLLNKPKLIIVDEPTAGLDPAERHRFLNVLRGVGTENIVLFSTHIVEDVRDLCTDLAIINRGKILRQAAPRAAIAELAGNIWRCVISPADLPTFSAKYAVLSSHYTEANALEVRVHAEARPGEAFDIATPKLDDVYFLTLNASAP